MRPSLSLVLPFFNEEETIPELERRLGHFLQSIGETWEVIMVDDGSSDRTRELLSALAERDPRYRLVGFSRNFGHQIAITAGIDYARGEATVVMDSDLQDPPEVVAQMLEKSRQGFDVVYGVRTRRENETIFKRATAAVFYRTLRMMVGVDIPLDTGDFRLMTRRVVLTMRSLRETSRFVRGMVAWVGFRQAAVYYERPGRFAGETHYPLRKMLKFAMDGVVSFSTVPLRFATWLGVACGFAALCVAAWAVGSKLWGQPTVPGWATIMLAVSVTASAQLLMIGILGEYIGRIYEEVKRRPLYVVETEINALRDDDSTNPD